MQHIDIYHVYKIYLVYIKKSYQIYFLSEKISIGDKFRLKQFCHLICNGEQTKEPTGMKKNNAWAKAFWIILQF